MDSAELFALPVHEDDLERLELAIRQAVLRGDPFLDEVATHLIVAGGKRLRPALTLAAASLDGRTIEEANLLGGVSVELIHLASLYHDDVMDEAVLRRGAPSVNARYGNLVAIVAGDFLLARSAEIAASLGTEVAGLVAATLARLCQGQIAEVRSTFNTARTEADYLAAIADKTGSLMAAACRIGGITAGLDRRRIDALTEFGECLGMVFQIRDDVLDVVASEAELGKAPGQDLAEGVYTLPVQRALADGRVGGELTAMLGRPLGTAEIVVCRELIASSSAIAEAAEVARRYALAAVAATELLGDSVATEGLRRLSLALADDLDRSTRALAS